MLKAFLTSTSSEGLRPLGDASLRSWELISGSLRDRLSDAHAALFADPEATQYGDRTDWYAPIEGVARPLSELPDEEAEAARARAAELRADIEALADTLREGPTGSDRSLAEALDNALEIPSEDSVWVVTQADGSLQPVLVNWASVEDRQNAVRGVLKGFDSRAAAKAEAARAAAATAAQAAALQRVEDDEREAARARAARAAGLAPVFWWLIGLGWLILLLMIAAILYLMIEACALRVPGLVSFCPAPEPGVSAEIRRASLLRDQIAQVERQIGIADRACQPAPPPPPPPPEPERTEAPPVPAPPPAQSEADRRRARAGGQLGDLTFTLVWDGPDDLDLHVTCPRNVTLNWQRTRGCGGQLDVDANANSTTRSPVENIFFNGPPAGQYNVRVHNFRSRTGGGARRFELQISGGGRSETVTGTVRGNRASWNHSYRWSGQ